MQLSTPVEELPKIGEKIKKRLKKLGINTVGELLFYFPKGYQDFSKIKLIKDLKLNEKACIAGKITEINFERSPRKKMVLIRALIKDESGTIQAIWFNQPYLVKILRKGDKILLAGRVNFSKENIYLSPIAYEKIKNEEPLHLGRIVPIYNQTAGLSSRWLRSILKPLVLYFKDKIPETIPKIIRKQYNILPVSEALFQIHFPDSLEKAEKAKERFAFEELFFVSIFNLKKKYELSKFKAPTFLIKTELIQDFINSLPFTLTNAQKKSAWQILKDLEKEIPMNRLLQGDVGSGKTVVTAIACLNIAKQFGQVVLMAPTEILAKQHFETFFKLFNKDRSYASAVNIGFLTGKEDKFYSRKLNQPIEISRQKLFKKTELGEIDILIGTQALIAPTKKKKNIGPKVKFKNLGLIIIDEQHRFGVKQRAALRGERDGLAPHFLSMTATPIPRSLALTVWGDLDLSIIDEMPKERKKIITKIVKPAQRQQVYEFIRKEVHEGHQAFIVCPRIEEKEDEIKSVEKEYKILSENVFPDLKVKMLHGKMKTKEKEKIMEDFKNKKFDILVSTSVVEVGIDIPNATVMVIEGAERFGLAQLHQFRGRVGRSIYQSYCFLFTDSPSLNTIKRLNALVKYSSGFELAEMDLKIRGPGDFLGVKQWGLPDLAMDSLKNLKLVEKAKEAAKEILKLDPSLKSYQITAKRLESFEEKIHLE